MNDWFSDDLLGDGLDLSDGIIGDDHPFPKSDPIEDALEKGAMALVATAAVVGVVCLIDKWLNSDD